MNRLTKSRVTLTMLESGSHQNVAVDSLSGKLMFRACYAYSNSSQGLSPIVSLLNPVPVSLENQARIYPQGYSCITLHAILFFRSNVLTLCYVSSNHR